MAKNEVERRSPYSAGQMEALTALCDTLLPSIHLPHHDDDSLTQFYRASASMTGTPQHLAVLLGEKIEHPKIYLSKLALTLLSTWMGTFILCGTKSLSPHFPYFQRFSRISLDNRHQILLSWSRSYFLLLRFLYSALKIFTLLVFFTQMSTQPTISNTGAFHKEQKSRRSWTVAEEKNLLLAFKDIIADGWKSPNGFRTGFITQLEHRLKVYMPHTDLKGDPNISSKYTSWKKIYFQITTALGTSGFGWNSTTQTVEAEPEQWDVFLQRFPTHNGIRGKPFPFYEAWIDIYGKDRATGHSAMDCNAAAEQIPMAAENQDEDSEGHSYHPVMLSEDDDTPARSTNRKESPPTVSETVSKSNKRKRKSKGEDKVVDSISEFCSSAATSFKEVVAHMGSKVDPESRARRELFEAIGTLPIAITLDDHVDATNILANNPRSMDAFFGMPDFASINMVQKVTRAWTGSKLRRTLIYYILQERYLLSVVVLGGSWSSLAFPRV